MDNKYLLVGLTHFVSVALVLKVLNYILPCCISCYYTCTGKLILCLIVAKLTFSLSKKKFLSDRIQPDNRAVLITGCDSGFGNGLAKQLDSLGFHVFASCLFPSGTGAEELKKRCSKRLQIFGLDVAKSESVKEAVEFVMENLGTSELWAVVNNAGVFKGLSTELTDIQDFKDTMEVNTFGAVRVTKAFLPLLRQSRGRVVNVASMAGRIALPNSTPYSMSKFATVALSECLRNELEVWGVRVISIEPEFFETEMTKSENIAKNVDATFASIDKDVKADYGEKYLKDFKQNFECGARMLSPKTYKVLNALEMAISLEHPDAVYRPSRNCVVSMFFHLYGILPVILRDLLFKFYLYISSFPKPIEADNNL